MLLVGLGNPGKQYQSTRHNVGFMLMDRLLESWGSGTSFSSPSRLGGSVARIEHRGRLVIVFKPETYMNRSGGPVQSVAHYYRIPTASIVVACDDVNISFGTVRIRGKGGAGGHNGLASIQEALGSTDYARLRIGVGGGAPGQDLTGWVLGRFSQAELEIVPRILDHCVEALGSMLERGLEVAMSQFNGNVPGALAGEGDGPDGSGRSAERDAP